MLQTDILLMKVSTRFFRILAKELRCFPEVKAGELLKLMEQHGTGTNVTRHEYPTLIVRRVMLKGEAKASGQHPSEKT